MAAFPFDLDDAEPAHCPDAPKIGSVEIDTPLLDHPVPGAVYVAAQNDNPFDSLLAIYIAVDDGESQPALFRAGDLKMNRLLPQQPQRNHRKG